MHMSFNVRNYYSKRDLDRIFLTIYNSERNINDLTIRFITLNNQFDLSTNDIKYNISKLNDDVSKLSGFVSSIEFIKTNLENLTLLADSKFNNLQQITDSFASSELRVGNLESWRNTLEISNIQQQNKINLIDLSVADLVRKIDLANIGSFELIGILPADKTNTVWDIHDNIIAAIGFGNMTASVTETINSLQSIVGPGLPPSLTALIGGYDFSHIGTSLSHSVINLDSGLTAVGSQVGTDNIAAVGTSVTNAVVNLNSDLTAIKNKIGVVDIAAVGTSITNAVVNLNSDVTALENKIGTDNIAAVGSSVTNAVVNLNTKIGTDNIAAVGTSVTNAVVNLNSDVNTLENRVGVADISTVGLSVTNSIVNLNSDVTALENKIGTDNIAAVGSSVTNAITNLNTKVETSVTNLNTKVGTDNIAAVGSSVTNALVNLNTKVGSDNIAAVGTSVTNAVVNLNTDVTALENKMGTDNIAVVGTSVTNAVVNLNTKIETSVTNAISSVNNKLGTTDITSVGSSVTNAVYNLNTDITALETKMGTTDFTSVGSTITNAIVSTSNKVGSFPIPVTNTVWDGNNVITAIGNADISSMSTTITGALVNLRNAITNSGVDVSPLVADIASLNTRVGTFPNPVTDTLWENYTNIVSAIGNTALGSTLSSSIKSLNDAIGTMTTSLTAVSNQSSANNALLGSTPITDIGSTVTSAIITFYNEIWLKVGVQSISPYTSLSNAVSTITSHQIPVGTIVHSIFTETQYRNNVGDTSTTPTTQIWVLADGLTNITGSKYHAITSQTMIPNLMGKFLRGSKTSVGTAMEATTGTPLYVRDNYNNFPGWSYHKNLSHNANGKTYNYELASMGQSGTTDFAGNHDHVINSGGSHTHMFNNYNTGAEIISNPTNYRAVFLNSSKLFETTSSGEHTHTMSVAGSHRHEFNTNSIVSYDAETAPEHVLTYIYIKIN